MFFLGIDMDSLCLITAQTIQNIWSLVPNPGPITPTAGSVLIGWINEPVLGKNLEDDLDGLYRRFKFASTRFRIQGTTALYIRAMDF